MLTIAKIKALEETDNDIDTKTRRSSGDDRRRQKEIKRSKISTTKMVGSFNAKKRIKIKKKSNSKNAFKSSRIRSDDKNPPKSRLKIRRKETLTQQPDLTTCDCFADYTLEELYRESSDGTTINQYRLLQIYQIVFGRGVLPPENWSDYMIYLKISYELCRQQMIKKKQKITPGFIKNYHIAMSGDVANYTDVSKIWLEYFNKNKGDNTMKKKIEKVKEVKKVQKEKATDAGRLGKTSGLTVRQYWHKLYTDNFKMKQTDDKLSAAIKREFPKLHLKAFDNVSGVRGLYNKGEFGAVKQQSVAYDKKGNPIEKKKAVPNFKKKADKKSGKAKEVFVKRKTKSEAAASSEDEEI